MSRSIFDLQAERCQTMSSPARLRIVHLLRQGPHRVGDIATSTGFAQSNVSQHLAILRHRGIVSSERRGGETIYRITSPKIVRVCDMMREVLAEQAAERSQLITALEAAR